MEVNDFLSSEIQYLDSLSFGDVQVKCSHAPDCTKKCWYKCDPPQKKENKAVDIR